jgi:branched-chain amino acid aminotransferase
MKGMRKMRVRKTKAWINGKLRDAGSSSVSVFDRGFLYGDGVFETMRSYGGAVFRIDEHLERLFRGLKVTGIRAPYPKKSLRDAVSGCLSANGLKDAYIRLTVTRGEGRFGLNYSDRFSPNVVIVAKKFGEYPAKMYARGITAAVVSIRRNEMSPASRIKSLNFLDNILARLEAKARRADEAILMNTKGYVAEASTSNIFLAKGGVLITPSPDSGILAGVTRKAVIEIAGKVRIRVKEKPVSRGELLSADEVFLTSSLIEILPVVRIDSRKVGPGSPGPLANLLRSLYRRIQM